MTCRHPEGDPRTRRGPWCGAWKQHLFAKPGRCGMRLPKVTEKAASEQGRCRHGAPATVRGIGQPLVNWRPSRRGKAQTWEWLKFWQYAYLRSQTKAGQRRGCGASSQQSVPSKTCASSHPLLAPSTGASREEVPSQGRRIMRPQRCSATYGSGRHRRGTAPLWPLSSLRGYASGGSASQRQSAPSTCSRPAACLSTAGSRAAPAGGTEGHTSGLAWPGLPTCRNTASSKASPPTSPSSAGGRQSLRNASPLSSAGRGGAITRGTASGEEARPLVGTKSRDCPTLSGGEAGLLLELPCDTQQLSLIMECWRRWPDQGALQFRKLWRSIVRCHIVVWVDNWWHAQFRANPVKPNVCLDVTAIAVLHTTPPSPFSWLPESTRPSGPG